MFDRKHRRIFNQNILYLPLTFLEHKYVLHNGLKFMTNLYEFDIYAQKCQNCSKLYKNVRLGCIECVVDQNTERILKYHIWVY